MVRQPECFFNGEAVSLAGSVKPRGFGGAPGSANHRLHAARSGNLGRRPAARGLMRPAVVAEPEIVHQRHPQLPPADKDLRVDEFVLQPEPLLLEENTVRPAAAAVHADPDPAVPQRGGETGRSELRIPARVENLRRALA